MGVRIKENREIVRERERRHIKNARKMLKKISISIFKIN